MPGRRRNSPGPGYFRGGDYSKGSTPRAPSRRQGRLPEAEGCSTGWRRAGSPPWDWLRWHSIAAITAGAAEQATRYLRRIPADNCSDRAEALYLLVRVRTGMGELKAAEECGAELAEMAARADTPPLRALASMAAGHMALGRGQADHARQHFEDAVDGFLLSGAPFEVARARLELAHTLARLGRREASADEARCALELLSEPEGGAGAGTGPRRPGVRRCPPSRRPRGGQPPTPSPGRRSRSCAL